ncbi:MAG: polysaccharide biosynthesis protein [Chloroflexi bacterium]|nr:polysaccharide biosynthesis protein [Chloroflexota bacterium]
MPASGIAITGRILGRGLGYLSQIVLARILAPDGYGIFAIGWTILRLFSIAGHLGLDYGVTKFGTQYWGKDQTRIKNLVILSTGSAFMSGLIFGLILNITAPWLAEVVFRKPELEQILQGIALTFPFATTLRVLAATSIIQGKTIYGAISEDIIQPVVQMILFLLLIKTFGGISAAITSTIISYAVSTIVGAAFVTYLIPNIFSQKSIITKDLLPLFRFSLPAIVGATLGAFNLWGDRLLVGYFGTKFDTGIYQSISIITMLTTIVLSGMKISAAPAISRMSNDDRRSDIESLSKSISRWSLYLTMPMLLFVFTNANNVITIFFGEKYQAGVIPLLILTAGQAFYVTFGITDQVLLMTGRQKEWLTISTTVFLLTVFFDALLIPKLHLLGASLVSTAMIILLGILSILCLKHYLNFWLLDSSHFKIIATTLLSGLFTYPITLQLSSLGNALGTFISLVTTGAIFVLFLFVYGMDPRDKIQLITILRNWNKKGAHPLN